MEIILSKILSEIRHKEDKISSQMIRSSDEAYQMTLFLNEMLCAIKTEVLQVGFLNEDQEVDFFKNVKPQILGKLIYYNKLVVHYQTNAILILFIFLLNTKTFTN